MFLISEQFAQDAEKWAHFSYCPTLYENKVNANTETKSKPKDLHTHFTAQVWHSVLLSDAV